MTREQRITNGTIGILLCISAIAVYVIIPAVNVWPWVLLFASVGIGLSAGAAASKDAQNRAARQMDAARDTMLGPAAGRTGTNTTPTQSES